MLAIFFNEIWFNQVYTRDAGNFFFVNRGSPITKPTALWVGFRWTWNFFSAHGSLVGLNSSNQTHWVTQWVGYPVYVHSEFSIIYWHKWKLGSICVTRHVSRPFCRRRRRRSLKRSAAAVDKSRRADPPSAAVVKFLIGHFAEFSCYLYHWCIR